MNYLEVQKVQHTCSAILYRLRHGLRLSETEAVVQDTKTDENMVESLYERSLLVLRVNGEESEAFQAKRIFPMDVQYTLTKII